MNGESIDEGPAGDDRTDRGPLPCDGGARLIVAEGVLPGGSGFRARARRRAELPGPAVGTALVLVDAVGDMISVEGGLTVAERYWLVPTAWLRIDVTEHHSLCSVHVPDDDGSAGLAVELFVAWQVVDPLVVAERRITTAADVLDATLTGHVRRLADRPGPSEAPDPPGALRRLGSARRRMAGRLAGLHGADLDTPDWLAARVLGVLVAFDETTQHHVDELLAAGRRADRDDVTAGAAGGPPDPPESRGDGHSLGAST